MDYSKYSRKVCDAVNMANIHIEAARYRWDSYETWIVGGYGERDKPNYVRALDDSINDLRALRENATDRATKTLLTRTINRVLAEKKSVLDREAARR